MADFIGIIDDRVQRTRAENGRGLLRRAWIHDLVQSNRAADGHRAIDLTNKCVRRDRFEVDLLSRSHSICRRGC